MVCIRLSYYIYIYIIFYKLYKYIIIVLLLFVLILMNNYKRNSKINHVPTNLISMCFYYIYLTIVKNLSKLL